MSSAYLGFFQFVYSAPVAASPCLAPSSPRSLGDRTNTPEPDMSHCGLLVLARRGSGV